MKFCHMSMLRAEIEACRTGDFENWKESNIVFFPCCFKSQTPIYKIPVERALKENFYDLCVEAWNAPIPQEFDKRTDSSCPVSVCDWTGTEITAIEVNFSTSCNAKCVFCKIPHKYVEELELFYFTCLDSIRQSNNDVTIGLTSAGEPFFNKKRTFNFLKDCKNRIIKITSNLLNLTPEDAIELDKIRKENNLQIWLHASMNGDNKNCISKIEGIDVDFSQLKSVLDILNKNGILTVISDVIIPETVATIPTLKDTLENISTGLSSKLLLLTDLDSFSDNAKIVMETEEWKDFFKDKPANMNNAPKSLVLE